MTQAGFLLVPGPVPALASRPSVGCTATGTLIFLGFLASLLPCLWLLAIAVSSAPKCSYWWTIRRNTSSPVTHRGLPVRTMLKCTLGARTTHRSCDATQLGANLGSIPCAYSLALSKLFAAIGIMPPLRSATEPIAWAQSLLFVRRSGGQHLCISQARCRSRRHSVQTAAENRTAPSWGRQPLKASMFTDSRKAQRNSIAHHRAYLLFAGPAKHFPQVEHVSALGGIDASALNQRVRAGLIGFVPKGVAPHIDRGVTNDA